MATRPKRPKCKHCKHAWSKHTTQPTEPCAQRMPVGWVGQGHNKRPIMGYCPCPKYEPMEG
jgi:hypothetical protein